MKNRISRLKMNLFVTIAIHSFLILALIFCWPLSSVCGLFVSNAAAAIIIDPGPDISVCKDLPLAGHVTLNQDNTSPPNNTITHMWFGPFETNDQLSPSVIIPEGRYTVSHIINTGSELSDVTTSLIEARPCFSIAARDKSGKVQLTWAPVAGSTLYEIFRAQESNPQHFVKIAETVSDYATYLDYAVQNESSYLYLVSALSNGEHVHSNVISAHPTAVRSRTRPNYAPLIYSSSIDKGTVGILYNYDINVSDPNNDTLSYSLISPPGGMTIARDTGRITWTPGTDGTYPVNARVEDGKGGYHTQNFTITVEKMAVPVVVDLTVEPLSIPEEGGQVTLTWSSVFAETVSIDNGIGPVDLNGTRVLSLQAPTTFTITATGPGGTKTDVVTINYRPSVSLQAVPESILKGDAAVLSWSSSHADTVSIDPDIGTVSPDGSIQVSPAITTTYTITATGPGGQAVSEAVLSVFEMPTATIEATPQTIKAGESVILTWHTAHAGSVSIDQGIGNVGPDGSVNVSPSVTTPYTITATGPGGTATNQATVTVRPAPVIAFGGTPQVIKPGEVSSLTWTCTHADTVSIDNGIGSVSPSGSLEVTPSVTTTYTLTATGSGGTTTAQVVVSVASPPTLSFTADPSTIATGQSATLTWSSANADTVTIDQGIGAVAKIGSLVVSPTVTTTYTITATGSGGIATAQAVVTIVPPPTISSNADPSTISAGQSATLTWSTENADTVTIDQGIGTVALSGAITVSPSVTTTYTLTAIGTGGTTQRSATVQVSAISLNITTPAEDEALNRRDMMVEGTLFNSTGLETGVSVNGIIAFVYGNQFFANHVPLVSGENTISAVATDSAGNTVTVAHTVTAEVPVDYITVNAIPAAGTPPLETVVGIDATFGFSASNISYSGPDSVESLSATANEYTIRATTPGVYVFTVAVSDAQGAVHSDSVAVRVIDPAAVNALLSAKWNSMKTALIAGDVETALGYYQEASQDKYRAIYTALGSELPGLVQNMREISPIYFDEFRAKYRIHQDQVIDGQTVTITYYIYFSVDTNGIWRIEQY